MIKIGIALSVGSTLLVALSLAFPPGAGSQIAFETYENSNSEIYLLDMNTGIAHNLTRHERGDSRPVWSPDGQWIAFASNRTDNYEIFVMDANGGHIQNLTRHASDDFDPGWSPDGSRIVFVSRRDGNSEIYVMEVASILANPACTTLPYNFLLNESQPCATTLTRLTHTGTDEISPVWSPQGARIAYVEETEQDSEIFVLNADYVGGEGALPNSQYNLSDDPARDRDPAWSPDGRCLAFASNRDGLWNIYVTRADGSQTRKLTTGRGAYVHPTWSPDGQQILFTQWSGTAGWALYLTDVQCVTLPEGCGRNLQLLTDSPIDGFRPAWRP